MKNSNKILLAVIGIAILVFLIFFNSESGIFKGLLKVRPLKAGIDKLIIEKIPQDWIDQFNKDFKITFIYIENCTECIIPEGIPNREEAEALILENDSICTPCRIPYVAFTEEEKLAIKEATYRNFYAASKIDSYFKKTLPWTEGKSLYNWLKDTIDTISYFDKPDQVNICCGNDGKTIIINGRTLLNNIQNGFDKKWFDATSGMSFYKAFISIYIHEARHANANSGEHTDCEGDNISMGDDDVSLQSMGGYGVTALFEHWMRYMLPEEIVNETINKYGQQAFNITSLERFCTFDIDNKELDQDDQDWIKSISGYEINCDDGVCI